MNIDPLYFLLLAESSLVLLTLTIYFFSNNRKNKDLYQKTLRKLNDLKSEKGLETFDRPFPDEAALPEPPAEEIIEQHEASNDIASMDSFEPEPPVSGTEEGGQGAIRRLQRMVNFQKSTIVELMCYKDVFEGAKKRLASLQRSNEELQEKISGLIESGVDSPVLGETVNVLEKGNNEMEKFISILDSENSRLTEKFRDWEDEFNRIANDAEEVPDAGSGTIDDEKYAEMLSEKESMITRIKDFEEKLDEKSNLLSSMQVQYEDLEKEYMILYRQQQQQQAAAQPE